MTGAAMALRRLSMVSNKLSLINSITTKSKQMETLRFKTNINCGGCIARVTPYLNEEKAIKSWNVDTANPQKILTVETDSLSENEVEQIVREAGFKADKL